MGRAKNVVASVEKNEVGSNVFAYPTLLSKSLEQRTNLQIMTSIRHDKHPGNFNMGGGGNSMNGIAERCEPANYFLFCSVRFLASLQHERSCGLSRNFSPSRNA